MLSSTLWLQSCLKCIIRVFINNAFIPKNKIFRILKFSPIMLKDQLNELKKSKKHLLYQKNHQ